jgi:hypothetical protein
MKLDVLHFWEGRQKNCCVHVIGLNDGDFSLLKRNADFSLGRMPFLGRFIAP